ncbi:MAG: protein kinase [Acidobacteria bacterium]|nr:protein kinase [Acidobacteriota bacterium]MBI3426448.1 protein kinase [Acidobacteriota bacterium]
MTPERYQQIEALYHAALERTPAQRAAYLAQGCADDEELLGEVTSLLAAHAEAGSFIVQPALEVAATLLAQDKAQAATGRWIDHYQILELIGVGGMGEVHLAQDVRLQRKVALKLLPTQWSNDAERIRRFLKEAQAASALNHPNIITIYEVGQENGTPFIASEYIDGQTLRQMLGQTLPLAQVLDIATQIAAALAAAHAAGIIHRDIKPENVMVRHDGLVKVLDFGLAKPTTSLPALLEGANPNSTAPGVILGTLRYMSPEQGRGLRVDARTDIFSFGVLLYELLTGRLPFTGRTASDVLAALLLAAPPPLPEQLPVELQRVVAQALGKEPEERYQNADTLWADLKRLKRVWERQTEGVDENATSPFLLNQFGAASNATVGVGNATAAAGGTRTNGQPNANTNSSREILLSGIRRHRRSVAAIASLILCVLVGLGYGAWHLFQLSRQATAFQAMKLTKLTTHGKVASAENALSPDGKYVVYVLAEGDQRSLQLLHIPTGGIAQITPTSSVRYDYPAFSPDGNYVLYQGKEKAVSAALYRVPVVGGTPVKLLDNIDSAVTFAPGGDRFAYLSQDHKSLFVANQDGTNIQTLAVNQDDTKWHHPVWSPDGEAIVCANRTSKAAEMGLIAINVKSGALQALGSSHWLNISGLAWQRDGSGLLLSAADSETKRYQLWALSYPDGVARRVTNDVSNYYGASLAANASKIVFTRGANVSNLWLVPYNASHQARQISFEAEIREGIYGLAWTPDQRLVYSTHQLAGNHELWLLNPADGQKRQLTMNAGDNQYPTISPDGKTLVFVSNRSGRSALWQMSLTNGQPKLLAEPEGVATYAQHTPDGQWIVFKLSREGRTTLWKIPSAGGAPVQISASPNAMFAISPDGHLVASGIYDETNSVTKLTLTPLRDENPVRLLDFPTWAISSIRWMPDGRGLTYIDRRGPGQNLVNLPFTGGSAKPLTDFPSGIIYYFDWSRDGKWLALARGNSTDDLVLLSDFTF